MATSATINYKARSGDTVNSIALAAGVKPSEILALNSDLQVSPNMVANKIYRLPRSAANNSATAVSDLIIEFRARKTEAGRPETPN